MIVPMMIEMRVRVNRIDCTAYRKGFAMLSERVCSIVFLFLCEMHEYMINYTSSQLCINAMLSQMFSNFFPL